MKAPEENGIENEAWRLMLKEIGKILFKLLNKIWKERGLDQRDNKPNIQERR